MSSTAATTQFYRDLVGFSVVHADTGYAIVQRDDCVIHLWLADDSRWRDRADFAARPVHSGAESFLAGTASCRIEVHGHAGLDQLYEEMKAADVLHSASRAGVSATDYGTREVHVCDPDGNLLSFFQRV